MDINNFTTDRDLTSEPLNDEEKAFLTENAADLSDDLAKHYGIDNSPKVPDPVVRGKKEEPAPATTTPPTTTTKEGEEEDDDDPKVIASKAAAAAVEPLKKQMEATSSQLQEQRDIIEVDEFIKTSADKYPMAGKYRDAMLRYMKVYTNVPADGVFAIVAKDDLIRIGAQKERQAASKANGTRVPTNSGRPQEKGKKDWGSATPEEVAAKRAEVLGRPQ